MRIATWNIERLKHKANIDRVYEEIENAAADILVLTETDSMVIGWLSLDFCRRL